MYGSRLYIPKPVSNGFPTDISQLTYASQNAVQPVENLLLNSGHCYRGFGILLQPEAIPSDAVNLGGCHVIIRPER